MVLARLVMAAQSVGMMKRIVMQNKAVDDEKQTYVIYKEITQFQSIIVVSKHDIFAW